MHTNILFTVLCFLSISFPIVGMEMEKVALPAASVEKSKVIYYEELSSSDDEPLEDHDMCDSYNSHAANSYHDNNTPVLCMPHELTYTTIESVRPQILVWAHLHLTRLKNHSITIKKILNAKAVQHCLNAADLMKYTINTIHMSPKEVEAHITASWRTARIKGAPCLQLGDLLPHMDPKCPEIRMRKFFRQNATIIGELPEAMLIDLPFLKDPKRVRGCGLLHAPKATLLVGEPGGGKSLSVKALATQTERYLRAESAGPLITSMQGSAAAQITQIFEDAKAIVYKYHEPVIIFIDEIDAISRKNETNNGEADRGSLTLNTALDSIKDEPLIYVVFATNTPEIVHESLLSRCNQVLVSLPDLSSREKLIAGYFAHQRQKADSKTIQIAATCSSNDNIRTLATDMEGMSCRDIAEIIDLGIKLAAKGGQFLLSLEHFQLALCMKKKSGVRPSQRMDLFNHYNIFSIENSTTPAIPQKDALITIIKKTKGWDAAAIKECVTKAAGIAYSAGVPFSANHHLMQAIAISHWSNSPGNDAAVSKNGVTQNTAEYQNQSGPQFQLDLNMRTMALRAFLKLYNRDNWGTAHNAQELAQEVSCNNLEEFCSLLCEAEELSFPEIPTAENLRTAYYIKHYDDPTLHFKENPAIREKVLQALIKDITASYCVKYESNQLSLSYLLTKTMGLRLEEIRKIIDNACSQAQERAGKKLLCNQDIYVSCYLILKNLRQKMDVSAQEFENSISLDRCWCVLRLILNPLSVISYFSGYPICSCKIKDERVTLPGHSAFLQAFELESILKYLLQNLARRQHINGSFVESREFLAFVDKQGSQFLNECLKKGYIIASNPFSKIIAELIQLNSDQQARAKELENLIIREFLSMFNIRTLELFDQPDLSFEFTFLTFPLKEICAIYANKITPYVLEKIIEQSYIIALEKRSKLDLPLNILRGPVHINLDDWYEAICILFERRSSPKGTLIV